MKQTFDEVTIKSVSELSESIFQEPLPHVEHQLEFPMGVDGSLEVTFNDSYSSHSVDLSFCLFASRYELISLSIDLDMRGSSGLAFHSISSTYIANLSIPKAAQVLLLKAIPNSEYWTDLSVKKDLSDEYLAQLYTFHHFTYGNPREAVMQKTGWSRANANYHLRRIKEQYKLSAVGNASVLAA